MVSALIGGRKPRRLLKTLFNRGHSIIISEAIVEEFSRVSADEKIRRYVDDEDVSGFIGTLLSRATFVRPESDVVIFHDPDDKVLSTAKDGGADVIVTGDRHILDLRKFGRTRILTVDEALSLLKGQKAVSASRRPGRPKA